MKDINVIPMHVKFRMPNKSNLTDSILCVVLYFCLYAQVSNPENSSIRNNYGDLSAIIRTSTQNNLKEYTFLLLKRLAYE